MSVRKYKTSPTLKDAFPYTPEHVIADCDDKALNARDGKALSKHSGQQCLTLKHLRAESLDFLNDWSDLRDLRLYGCKIDDYTALKKCKTLQALWLNGLRAKSPDLSFLADLKSLVTLGVGYVTYLKTFPDLSKRKKLKRLSIFNCKNLADIDTITKIPKLESFSIVCTPQIPEDLEPIMQMKSLKEISGAFGTAKGDRVLKNMMEEHGLTYG